MRQFIAERKAVARPFAEEALSWSGKWAFLKSKSPWGEDADYQQFLREGFERHVFKEEDIADLTHSAVEGYLSELIGIENETLLALRADLSDSALAQCGQLPALDSDDAFRQAVAAMMAKALRVTTNDVAVTAGRELASFVASDIATNITIEILGAVAARLGVEAGILGSGVVSARPRSGSAWSPPSSPTSCSTGSSARPATIRPAKSAPRSATRSMPSRSCSSTATR